MTQSVRTFIGVPVRCSRKLSAVLTTCREFGRSVHPVAEENIHFTLKFLGTTPAEKIAEISEILQAAVRQIEPFSSEIRGLGAFPHAVRPSIIWAGLRDPAPWVELADAIEPPLSELGFPRENRQFHPHMTLARVRDRPSEELKTWLDQQADTDFGSVDVQSVTLFQSDLSSAGPRHTVLATAPLANSI